jgi:hypothetical protein
MVTGIGAESGAATGPIPAEVRRQEGLKLERTRSKHHRARPSQGRASAKVRPRQERSDLSQARLIEVMHRMHHHAKQS